MGCWSAATPFTPRAALRPVPRRWPRGSRTGSTDPRVPGRQAGWVTQEPTAYVRPVRRLAGRVRKAHGQGGVGALISTLSPADVITLTRQPIDRVADPIAVLLAYVSFYDQRGGDVETSFKDDKQGLGLTIRTKKRFAS